MADLDIQLWGEFNMFPNNSHLFLRRRGAKVYSQTERGPWPNSPYLDPPLVMSTFSEGSNQTTALQSKGSNQSASSPTKITYRTFIQYTE